MNNEQPKKIVSFSTSLEDLHKIQKDINNGWRLIHLTTRGKNYIGILEKNDQTLNDNMLYIPPRKKIQIKC